MQLAIDAVSFSVTGVRRHFSFFYEHLRRCKYCPEAYSTPEEVVQHLRPPTECFFILRLSSGKYILLNKQTSNSYLFV